MSKTKLQTIAFLGGLGLVLLSGVLGKWIGGPIAAIIIMAIMSVTAFFLCSLLTLPSGDGLKYQLKSLCTFGAVVAWAISPESYYAVFVTWFCKTAHIPAQPSIPYWIRFGLPIIVGLILLLFNLINTRQQVLPFADLLEKCEDSPFPVQDYFTLRDRFCETLVSELDRYDNEVNWSDHEFTNLAAEVEIEGSLSTRRRIVPDLVAALQNGHKARAFLVIGDPGAGKSVSLRRLCRKLYKQVKKSGVVPLYVNLREWDGPLVPTDGDIADFIKKYIKGLAGRTAGKFLDKWYEPMLNYGLFFFILDSFDEMPPVLDCNDGDLRLKEISQAFDRFFNDIHKCRGILSSRPFRQPTGFRGCRLTIRPFSETQVINAMKEWLRGRGLDAADVVRRLFTDSPELVPAIRNPFTADLIAQYVSNHNGALPGSYYAIFDDYINTRLQEESSTIADKGFSLDDIRQCASAIAWTMYNTPESGLEAEIPLLERQLGDDKLDNKVNLMRHCRIARLGGVHYKRFSFAHRRFAEFFAVSTLLKQGNTINLDAIPTDSRWRDCLVVYCGVASPEEAKRLADYTWGVFCRGVAKLHKGDIANSMPSVHCLRFLRDAFVSRPASLAHFADELSFAILKILGNPDILAAKIAAEALPLLSPEAQSKGIITALERDIPWISDTALLASRNLPKPDKKTTQLILRYLRQKSTIQFLRSFQNLDFTFALSEMMHSQRTVLRCEFLWMLFLAASTIILCFNIQLLQVIGLVVCVFLCEGVFYTFYDKKKMGIRLLGRLGGEASLRCICLMYPCINSTEKPYILYRYANTVLHKAVSNHHISPWCCILIILLAMPLNAWTTTASIFSFGPEELRSLIRNLGIVSICLAIVAPFVHIIIYLFSYIPPSVQFIIAMLPICFLPYYLYPVLLNLYEVIADKRFLSKIDTAGTVSTEWIFDICRRLRSKHGRHIFLQMLRTNQVEVMGSTLPLPNEKWVDKSIKEDIARLEEYNLGLVE